MHVALGRRRQSYGVTRQSAKRIRNLIGSTGRSTCFLFDRTNRSLSEFHENVRRYVLGVIELRVDQDPETGARSWSQGDDSQMRRSVSRPPHQPVIAPTMPRAAGTPGPSMSACRNGIANWCLRRSPPIGPRSVSAHR